MSQFHAANHVNHAATRSDDIVIRLHSSNTLRDCKFRLDTSSVYGAAPKKSGPRAFSIKTEVA